MKNNHTYVLGTGLSHDGSACLLKDGEVCVAIEKERLTRLKHDGYNDTMAIKYCLNHEGIDLHDIDLVIQSALSLGNLDNGNDYFRGRRLFDASFRAPIITISHHMAHAYSAIGTCPFEDDFDVMVVDGSGSPFDECLDVNGCVIPDRDLIHEDVAHLYFEKDSYYTFSEGRLIPKYKDFSVVGSFHKRDPMQSFTRHSIGGLYEIISHYCLRNIMDAGKLMGLGPYGKKTTSDKIFNLKDGRVFLDHEWLKTLTSPAKSYEIFRENFQYYANIAWHVQREMERAIVYLFRSRLEGKKRRLCYAGGVALNAVANKVILTEGLVEDFYIAPAAGDNGIGLGCAFYGWMEVLGNKKKMHSGSTFFGKPYETLEIKSEIESFSNKFDDKNLDRRIQNYFELLPKFQEVYQKTDVYWDFEIKGHGNYVLSLPGKEHLEGTCCRIAIDRAYLARAIVDHQFWRTLFDLGKIEISDIDDFELFLWFHDLKGLSKDPRLEKGIIPVSIRKYYHKSNDVISDVAQLLADGKVIAWYQGGSEFGPRALGRRSILADPRVANVRNFINTDVKFREDFRPFAPSVLAEDVSKYFKYGFESPYMILVDEIKPEWADKLSNIVHEDGSCRVQTVQKSWNPQYYALIEEFKRITGLSVLLNTSFNRKGMPIVETPIEALNFFYACKLDYLIMGDFIIGKSEAQAQQQNIMQKVTLQ